MIARIPQALTGLLAMLRDKDSFIAEWQERVAELARETARTRHQGHKPWGQIAEAVRRGIRGNDRTVYIDSADAYGRIGVHKQEGGEIRPRNAKALAIPLPGAAARCEHHGESPSLAPSARDFFVLRARDKAFLGYADGKEFFAVWLLTVRVRQKPEPWWPTSSNVEAIGARTLGRWLKEGIL